MRFTYDDFCKLHSKPTSTVEWDAVTHVWRNAKCDVQAIWSHVNARRDVFVTGDKNFHRSQNKKRLLELGARRIEEPNAAAALLF